MSKFINFHHIVESIEFISIETERHRVRDREKKAKREGDRQTDRQTDVYGYKKYLFVFNVQTGTVLSKHFSPLNMSPYSRRYQRQCQVPTQTLMKFVDSKQQDLGDKLPSITLTSLVTHFGNTTQIY